MKWDIHMNDSGKIMRIKPNAGLLSGVFFVLLSSGIVKAAPAVYLDTGSLRTG